MTSVATGLVEREETLLERLRRVVARHFDPDEGSAFWLDRAEQLGLRPLRDIQCVEDLALLGEISAADLISRPLRDYIPRRDHKRLDRYITAQTGGATGEGVWTAYRQDEFEEAFVLPFVEAAARVGFPAHGVWLYAGPSGPHIIGRAAGRLAQSLGSAEPFCVDCDTRWARKLAQGSFAQQRYLDHVIDQAMAVVDHQAIDVLFTTPVVLRSLASRMSTAQRERIRGVHYGGMALAGDDLYHFQTVEFPNAVHLAGYGNTLFGCCLELCIEPGRIPCYYPWGSRLLLEVVDDAGEPVAAGGTGRVRFTRLDESMLIVRMRERDAAQAIAPPSGDASFHSPGLRNPHPHESFLKKVQPGIY